LDGTRFLGGGPDQTFELADIRKTLDTANGDIWIGSTHSLGLLHRAAYRTLGPKDGFTDSAAFVAVETPASVAPRSLGPALPQVRL
jgi:hypothetical protein